MRLAAFFSFSLIEFAASRMRFQVGPWEAFGANVLNALEANLRLTSFRGSTKSLMTGQLA